MTVMDNGILLVIGIWMTMGTVGAQEARWAEKDSTMVADIHRHILGKGSCVEDLRILCKDIGARLSGSPEADAAIRWGEETLRKTGAPEVRLQPVMVPHWERSTTEVAWMRVDGGEAEPLAIRALGGSVGSNGAIEGDVVVVREFEELDSLGPGGLNGQIAFFNRPMDPLMISAGGAYGGAYNQRSRGAVESAEHGGIAALVRSLTHAMDTFPHTGAMRYDDEIRKVPAAAVSTVDSRRIARLVEAGHEVRVGLEMDCVLHEDKEQANVIAEFKGTVHPDRYIVVGGTSTVGTLAKGRTMTGRASSTALKSCGLWWPWGISPGIPFGWSSSSTRRTATTVARPTPVWRGKLRNGMWRLWRATPVGMPHVDGPLMPRMLGPLLSEVGEIPSWIMGLETFGVGVPGWISVRSRLNCRRESGP